MNEPGTPLEPGAEPYLSIQGIGPDPMEAFQRWFAEARERSRMAYPDAMCLSTVDPEGWPEGRIVLLKGVHARGFVFFTNYESRKGLALERTPRAGLTFYWDDLTRQVRARGPVERVPEGESDAYFATRPRGSQIGAWASEQSRTLESRQVLETRAADVTRRFSEADIPRPPHWGGYVLSPLDIEFWQGRPDRLHDRIRFRRETPTETRWLAERLSP